MYAEFSATISSLKALKDMLASLNGLANYNDLVTAVSDVSSKLMAAQGVALASQEKQAMLADRIRELENAIAEMESWKHEAERYQLHQFSTGALAYALKSEMQQGQPMHYACASCMEKRQISKMQPVGDFMDCHACKLRIEFQDSGPVRYRPLHKEFGQ